MVFLNSLCFNVALKACRNPPEANGSGSIMKVTLPGLGHSISARSKWKTSTTVVRLLIILPNLSISTTNKLRATKLLGLAFRGTELAGRQEGPDLVSVECILTSGPTVLARFFLNWYKANVYEFSRWELLHRRAGRPLFPGHRTWYQTCQTAYTYEFNIVDTQFLVFLIGDEHTWSHSGILVGFSANLCTEPLNNYCFQFLSQWIIFFPFPFLSLFFYSLLIMNYLSRDTHQTGLEVVENSIFHLDIPVGNFGPPFNKFRLFWKFISPAYENGLTIYIPTEDSRIFGVTGKQPKSR